MTTAVEPVATELSVGSFHNQQDTPSVPASLSPALQLNVFPKLGFGMDRVPQPQGSPVLPHWMDSKQIPSRSTGHGASIEFIPEMGPSTPMQGTPKQKHSVVTPQGHPDALLHSRGSQHEDQKVSLPLELVEKSSGLKQVLQQSCSPPKATEEQQSQKENMLTFSLGTSKSPVQATSKGHYSQQRYRIGQPPSTRALATLAASKISIAPEDLQLQQAVKGVQQPVLVDSHRSAAACIAGVSSKRGVGVVPSGALNGSIQLDLFKASSTSQQVYAGSGQNTFGPQFRAIPMASIADGTTDGFPGRVALHLQGGSPQPEHWFRRSTLTSTVPRWLDVCTPGTGHAGTQWHERTPGFTSNARSPGMLLAPQTPFEGGAYSSVLNGTPGKDCKQALEELEMKVYGNLSRKRKIASPEKVPKMPRSTGHNSPGQQQQQLDPKLAVAVDDFRKLNGWTQREHLGAFPGAQPAVEEQPQFSLDRSDASSEHKFFPGRKAHHLGPAKPTDGRVAPNSLRDHVQFVSPKKEHGSNLVVGSSSVASPSAFALINNFKIPQSSAQQSGEATPVPLECGLGKYYVVPAHSPMPVPDPTISAGEPSLSLNFAHKIAQGSKVQAKMTSTMRSESDWGKSLALAASPITQDSPFRQRYAELQMYLKYCDEVRHDHLVEVFRSMSAAGRSGHALRLETRALWLNLEEGKEMDRIKSLNIMGAQSRDPSTRDLGELGCTPHGPRLPAPGNTPAS